MSTKLQPTHVQPATLGDTLFGAQAHRRRPVVAQMPNGQLVLCCRRTAKAKGWQVQGTAQGTPAQGTQLGAYWARTKPAA